MDLSYNSTLLGTDGDPSPSGSSGLERGGVLQLLLSTLIKCPYFTTTYSSEYLIVGMHFGCSNVPGRK